jgi:two-component system LytT family response regulator
MGANKSQFHGIDFGSRAGHSYVQRADITSANGSKTMATQVNDIAVMSGNAYYPGEGMDAEPSVRIRLILIDSDAISISAMRARLGSHRDFDIVGEASSGADALRKISLLRPDALLVDVSTLEASQLDGAELLSQPGRPLVVFLSAHRHYALQAFELGAADCLVKPIRDDRFEVTLNRLREQVARRWAMERPVVRESAAWPTLSIPRSTYLTQRITIPDRKRTRVVETNYIEWIGAAGDYTELHVRGTTHLLREPLSVLLDRLPANLFCRIHRSFAVNLNRVSGFKALRNQDLLVKLKDKTVLRASRTFSDGLRRALTQQCA